MGEIKAAHLNSFFSDNFASSTAVDKHLGLILDVNLVMRNIWVQVFKSGPIKICGRWPLKKSLSNFLTAVFYKFYLVHSWIFCRIIKSLLKKVTKIIFSYLLTPHWISCIHLLEVGEYRQILLRLAWATTFILLHRWCFILLQRWS